MKVIKVKEQKDGSAKVTLEYSKKEEQLLLEYAVNGLLKEWIQRYKKEK